MAESPKTFDMAERLRKLPPYLFAEIDKKKREARARGADLIDMGIGDPDLPTPPHIIEALKRAAENAANHRYPDYEGLLSFRSAVAQWYKGRFGVTLDAEREVLTLVGSKEGTAHMPLAWVNPGDVVLVPDPGYPVYAAGTWFAGGEFFAKVVAFARRHGIIVCHDAMYSELRFDGYTPPSFLETPGATEVGVEFHSLSKTYSMTGWRIGFCVGNARYLGGLGKIKTNVDSGVFQAVQEAGIAALTGPQDIPEQYRRIYQERRDVVVGGLRALGWEVDVPKAAFFVWAPVPKGLDSRAFASRLLEEVGCVVTPGVGFGPSGEGFYRVALTIDAKRLAEAMQRLKGLKL